jgi:CRISPR-associated protein Csd2
MANEVIFDPKRRHDFVLLFDVKDGNPNGDPDAGNLPRVDPETMHGLVTDVCLKRKIRDYVDQRKGTEKGYRIYIQSKGVALNTLHQEAYGAKGLKSTGTKQSRSDVDAARQWMCETFYDIRTFGAVMTTGVNCGQVRGPLQMTFARSIGPVIPMEASITRVAITKEEDAQVVEVEGEERARGKVTEMGRKPFVPYGLYRAHGFFSPQLAASTGVSAEDLKIFWEALEKMWDLDRSASRGMMAERGIYIFTHECPYGNAPAHKLFDLIRVEAKPECKAPRAFTDYTVKMEENAVPAGVTLTRLG